MNLPYDVTSTNGDVKALALQTQENFRSLIRILNRLMTNGLTTISTNGESSDAILPGSPVYMTSAGAMKNALANALESSIVFGVCVNTSSVAVGAPLSVQSTGFVVLTTGQWAAISGQVGGLTPGRNYYLSVTTAGFVISTSTSASAKYSTLIGEAQTATKLKLSIEPSTYLFA